MFLLCFKIEILLYLTKIGKIKNQIGKIAAKSDDVIAKTTK